MDLDWYLLEDKATVSSDENLSGSKARLPEWERSNF